MNQYSLKDAQEHLKQLIDDAQNGKTVVITVEDNRAVKLVPVTEPIVRKPRQAGSARGKIWMADDFDAPLSDFDEYM
ncbi:MAG: DUF2281 domain-containing protein [Chloroflexota bacterium]